MTLQRRVFLPWALALCAWAAEPTPPAAPLRTGLEAVAEYARPELDASATQISGMTLTSGRLTLVLGKGQAVKVMVSGQPRGLFFVGEGSLRYASGDPVEDPIIAFNLERNTSVAAVRTSTGSVVVDELREALIWFGGRPVPELAGTLAPVPDDGFQAHQAFFARSWKPLGSLMACRDGNAQDREVVLAELAGKGSRFLFLHDDADSRSDTFAAVTRQDYYGAPPDLREIPLSKAASSGTGQPDPAAPFTLKAVDLDMEATSGTEAVLQVKETIVPDRSGLRILAFNQNPGVYHRNKDVWEFQGVRIISVQSGDGAPLPFRVDHWKLLVAFPGPLPAGQPVALTFKLAGGFLARHDNDNYWELGTFPWFPQPELSGQTYTVHCRLAVAKPFLPVLAGRVIKREATATQNILETAIDRPVCFFTMAAGDYRVTEWSSPRTPVKVHLYGYAGVSSAAAERLGKTILGFIGFYETFLGKFPFEDLVVREQRELGHGQAPPGTLSITEEAFNPMADDYSRALAHAWINMGIAHEVAHQYWGINVKMRSEEDQWLTEAFAEYCAALAMRQVRSNGKDRFDRAINLWTQRGKDIEMVAPVAYANWIRGNRPGDYAFRQDLMYYKGALILAAIHKRLGDDGLVNFFANFQRIFGGRSATTGDMVVLLGKCTGQDWKAFFEQYYWGMGMPSERP